VLSCPASQPFGHLLTAHTDAGTILGGFCVNSFGIGTYTQGSVSGTGIVQQHPGTTQIAAFGTNLNLAGNQFGSINSFAESAPTFAIGTFSLS
jgi:glutaminase